MELNPKHPVTKGLHDHWHKVLAVLMMQRDIKSFVITPADVASLERMTEQPTVLAHDKPDGLHVLMFTSEREALEYASKTQGRG